ncbi:MAG: hypothetical protein AAF810_18000 [Cyanobacteria bacterium P01_D01_bin.36]
MSALRSALTAGQNACWMAVSLGLHSIYTGIEKVFEQIAREVDGSLQKGERWHKSLLEQMASDVVGVRSAVIDTQTFEALEHYLGFRHVVRSNYAYRLEPERIEANFLVFESCYESLCAQVDDICGFLIAAD